MCKPTSLPARRILLAFVLALVSLATSQSRLLGRRVGTERAGGAIRVANGRRTGRASILRAARAAIHPGWAYRPSALLTRLACSAPTPLRAANPRSYPHFAGPADHNLSPGDEDRMGPPLTDMVPHRETIAQWQCFDLSAGERDLVCGSGPRSVELLPHILRQAYTAR